jgi:hypothetical protein
MASKLEVGEVVHLVHIRNKWQTPTQMDVGPQSIRFNLGARRYWVDQELAVLEIVNGGLVATNHSKYLAGVLKGGKRNDAGELVFPEEAR